MLEFVLSFFVRGIEKSIRQYLSDRKLDKEFYKVCEEHKKAYEGLMATLNNIEKKEEISRLVNCLNNYLNLRISAEN